MNIKKICISISFLILTGCSGSILDDTSLDTDNIQIQGISITSGSTTASVIWITDPASTHQIVYGVASGSYTESTTPSTAETTTHLVDLYDLVTNQIYYFRIICSTNGYKTIQSAEYSFTTSSVVTVTSLTAGNITTTSADITWTTGVETTHLVEYGTTAGVYTQSTVQSSTPSTSHAVPLTGLTSGTEYFFRVKNFHAALPYSSSIELSFITTTDNEIAGPRIYLIGGLSTISIGSAVAGIDVYYPSADLWEQNITNIPIPVSFAGIAGYNNKIYIIGGFNNSGDVIDTVQIYDTVSDTWGTGASMTEKRANHSAVAINGIVYVTRGTTDNAGATWVAGGSFTLMYNIATDTWSNGGFTDLAYSSKTVVNFDNVTYYTGGKSATSTLQSTHDGIIVSLNQTTTEATERVLTNGSTTTATARVGHSGVIASVDDITYHCVIGGFSAITNTGCYIFNSVTLSTPLNFFHYLPYPFAIATTSNWAAVNTSSSFSSSGFASALEVDGTIYYFGGAQSHSSGGSQSVYSYDLDDFLSGSWETKSNMPTARFGHTALKF